MKKMKSVFAVLCAAFSGLFLASASPTLPKFIAHRDYAAADAPVNLATGDLNGDGIADLVVPNFNNSTNISVLLGKRDGSFQPLQLFDSGGAKPIETSHPMRGGVFLKKLTEIYCALNIYSHFINLRNRYCFYE